MMKRKQVGIAAAGAGVVALIAIAGTRSLVARRRPSRRRVVPAETKAEAHMWAVLAGAPD
jgi:hypothetical protein